MSGVEIASQQLALSEADGEILRLAEYWQARRQGRRMPTRKDLDVLDLRPWIGRLCILEFRSDDDLRFRLRGSGLSPLPGYESDGDSVDRVRVREVAGLAREQYLDSFAKAAPLCHRLELSFGGSSYTYQRLSLPLASGAGLPPMVMTLMLEALVQALQFWTRYADANGIQA